jgi:hypothetical protein
METRELISLDEPVPKPVPKPDPFSGLLSLPEPENFAPEFDLPDFAGTFSTRASFIPPKAGYGGRGFQPVGTVDNKYAVFRQLSADQSGVYVKKTLFSK